MINKRFTYAYSEFVHGKYLNGDFKHNQLVKNHIMELFNNMTVDEKLTILSLNFEHMWYKLWLDTPKSSNYFFSKNKFDQLFLIDRGERLKKLISKSKSVSTVWEIPKGKKNRSETDVNAAIREFEEETNLIKKNYRLVPGIKKNFVINDKNTSYITLYYVAVMKHDVDLTISFKSSTQTNEINDIKWMTPAEIGLFDIYDGQLKKFAQDIVRAYRRRIKL
jgi:8-oxo-dGTP pyrophosphatase MutT (NUDIX family)